MAVWPPTLVELKLDMKVDAEDERFDAEMQQTLDGAVAYVERVRTDVDFLTAGDPPAAADPTKTALVTDDLVLGTLRYARRLDLRRDTPVAMLVAGELGTAVVPVFDTDVEKLLRVGRYARLRFA